MIYKFYTTNHIPGVGHFSIITTVKPGKTPGSVVSEAHVFTLGAEPDHKDWKCVPRTGLENYPEIPNSEERLHEEALLAAKGIINGKRLEALKTIKNTDTCREELAIREPGDKLIFLKALQKDYSKELWKIANWSISDELKSALRSVESLNIVVEPVRFRGDGT